MIELVLPDDLAEKVANLYSRMEEDYDKVARVLGFSCEGCPDNCCDSYFQHHTYTEWAYLWRGLKMLPASELTQIEEWAENSIVECSRAEAKGERPQVMCPLNEKGLCTLYAHRLLVCRTHGVPAVMRRPDGKNLHFPGCFRCQDIVEKLGEEEIPFVERTTLLRQLVVIEDELLEQRRHLYPKIKMTIAEMIVKGPPVIPAALRR